MRSLTRLTVPLRAAAGITKWRRYNWMYFFRVRRVYSAADSGGWIGGTCAPTLKTCSDALRKSG